MKPENHLSVPELSGSMSSTEGTRQPLGPALCSTTWQPRASYQVGLEAKATFAQTTFQRAQWVREANWETLSSLHSIEPTGLKRKGWEINLSLSMRTWHRQECTPQLGTWVLGILFSSWTPGVKRVDSGYTMGWLKDNTPLQYSSPLRLQSQQNPSQQSTWWKR